MHVHSFLTKTDMSLYLPYHSMPLTKKTQSPSSDILHLNSDHPAACHGRQHSVIRTEHHMTSITSAIDRTDIIFTPFISFILLKFAFGIITELNPSFCASLTLCRHILTALTSPLSPTSPKATILRSTGLFL